MPRHSYERVPYDAIADYALAKTGTSMVAADERDGQVVVTLAGTADVPLRLWVFTDADGAEHRYERIEPFRDGTTVRFSA
jgi:hypothetical protein